LSRLFSTIDNKKKYISQTVREKINTCTNIFYKVKHFSGFTKEYINIQTYSPCVHRNSQK
jgi:hypothetical protein